MDDDSAYCPQRPDDLNSSGGSLQGTEDGSSHGTVREFQEEYQCQVCHHVPSAGIAQVRCFINVLVNDLHIIIT